MATRFLGITPRLRRLEKPKTKETRFSQNLMVSNLSKRSNLVETNQ